MKPEIKEQWTAALRSGEYPKTTERLHDNTGFCCLGVLCDLHAKATGQQWEPRQGSHVYLHNDAALPPSVVRWAGLDDELPKVGPQTLAELNDGNGVFDIKPLTFAEIADMIEAHL